MLEMNFWGFFVRFATSLAQAAPFILIGFVVAAVFRRFYGPQRTFEMFGSNRRSGLLRAWVIGMLLPVCSLGAIPIARELRRSGLSGGTILAFAISAPLFNPLSLLYGLTLSDPVAIISFAGCSLLIVTLLGVLWDKLFPDSSLPVPEEEPVAYGLRRIAAVGVASARDITGPSTLLILCGLVGVGSLGVLLPAGALQASFNHDNTAAPLLMAGVAVPVYATPMLAMGQMGTMFQHANSIGAAFVLLTLGAGMNIGLVVWLLSSYGFRKTIVWLLLLAAVAVGLGYAVDGPLTPPGIEPDEHTHAFDIYCQPFHSGAVPPNGYQAAATTKLNHVVQIFEWHALKILFGCLVVGLIVRLSAGADRYKQWVESGENENLKADFIIPSHVLGGIVVASLIAFSVIGCFIYYPAPEEVLEEMADAKTEALYAARHSNMEEASRKIAIYADWSRKLEVGTYLRHGTVSDYHHWKARLLREQLDAMEHAIEDADDKVKAQWVLKLDKTHRRLSEAFRTEL